MMDSPQGMMSSQPLPQPSPSQGMVSTPQQSQGFNGEVSLDGKKIQVKNGEADYQGKRYFVSHDGTLVIDDKGNLVGIIQNGEITNPTPEIIDQLKQKGIIEIEQPQGMAAQAPR